MKYLARKTSRAQTIVVLSGWTYEKHARQIRSLLLADQGGFCAYTERFVRQTDPVDVEHFDPRLKRKKGAKAWYVDGYGNWYAVLHWANMNRPRKIENWQPMMSPTDPSLGARICYRDGLFRPVKKDDVEARNLIGWLGWNRPELVADRERHVRRVKELRDLFGVSPSQLADLLTDELADFATALDVELGVVLPT